MSLESIELGVRHQSQQSDKPLITNMNTNHSLAFSQTFAQADIRKEEAKNVFIRTRETLFTQKSEYDLPIDSNKKTRQLFYRANPTTCHQYTQKDVLSLVNTIKMAAFLNQQNNDRRKYIENKELTIIKMKNQISNLESKIKAQKEMYSAKFNKLKRRSESLKKEKRCFSEKLKTEIIDYKTRIDSIKRRTSINPTTNFGTLNNTKQFRSKRHSQKYVRTERSQDRNMNYPYTYSFKNVGIQQIYPQTMPVMNAYHQRYQQFPNQFHLSGKPSYTIQQTAYVQNPQNGKRMNSNTQRPASRSKEQAKQVNLFELLGKHFKIPTTINSAESSAAQKIDESHIQSLLRLSRSRKNQQSCVSQKYSKQKEEESQILDDQILKKVLDQEKRETQSNPYSQTLSLSVSKKKSVRFAHVDFKIGNLGDSVQSQYTQTQRPFETRYRLRASQTLKKSRKKADSASQQASSISSVNDDIIDSIKLSSHSRIYKQKLAQSKYLPCSNHPQALVEDSQLQELNLIAVSNISQKRAHNSKQIRKKLQSLGESMNEQA